MRLPCCRFVLPLVGLAALAAAGSCSKKSSGADDEGGAAGEPSGGDGGAGGNEGGATGGGMGGALNTGGARGGSSGSGGGGAGGAPDAGVDAPAAPMPRACKGAPKAGEGEGAQALRTDMAVRKVLDTPDDATRLARDPISQKLFLMTGNGTISRLDVAGQTWSRTVVYNPSDIGLATGDQAYGMAFAKDGTLYVVSHITKLQSATTSRATVWKGTLAAGGARTWNKMAQTAAYGRSNTIFNHEWSGIVVSPDGKFVYINAGSRTDHGEAHDGARESALTAKIFRLPTDKAGVINLPEDLVALKAAGYVFAEGTRNSFDLEFAPNGDLLAGDNGPDADYHEELNFLQEGKHYGYPWRLGNEDNQMQFPTYDINTDKRRDPEYEAIKKGYWHNDPAFPAKPAVTFVEPILNAGVGTQANQYRDPVDGMIKRGPIATFSDHGSPLGLTFDPDAGDLCGAFAGGAFILRNGRAAGNFEPGRDLLLLELTKENGSYKSVKVTQLVQSFQSPVDAVLTGSKMWVLDRGGNGVTGKLWEIDMPTGK
ncbi:MAG: PQQ-dependent sugar dehydrogenase [Deltaproteobacteria bacterium]|nr:PQQ-dependent sugar dehydrogenase [Deltaproteobacteria bacterium]